MLKNDIDKVGYGVGVLLIWIEWLQLSFFGDSIIGMRFEYYEEACYVVMEGNIFWVEGIVYIGYRVGRSLVF